jgi:hypothetical protein
LSFDIDLDEEPELDDDLDDDLDELFELDLEDGIL